MGNAARVMEPSNELSILTVYDAQVGQLAVNNNGLRVGMHSNLVI